MLVPAPQWLKDAPLGEFLANRDFAPFLMPFCQYNTTWNEFCVQHINGMFYGPSVYVPPQDYIIIFTTWPSSVATRNLEHWSQMFRDDKLKLKKYSYGSDCTNLLRGAALPRSFHESCNMAAYGTPEPEEYDLSRITAPQAYMLGEWHIRLCATAWVLLLHIGCITPKLSMNAATTNKALSTNICAQSACCPLLALTICRQH